MTETWLKLLRKHGTLLLDMLLIFLFAAVLVRPLYQAKYLQLWPSIESTFIADGRFLAAHWPHPQWQPLWYCGTRFDYVYPPVLRYGTALLTNFFIPVKAYHVFTALLFCLGIAGVYFLVRAMGSPRFQAWLSAAACALVSPSFLFMKEMRYDAPNLMPVRLGAMVRYGEGPHISSLSLLPFALGFAFLGMRRRRNGALVLAAVFSALVALTNFYGATALAILYPILVWSVWVAERDRSLWKRALAIPTLAWGLSAFWLTPSYFRITLYNLRYVSEPGNRYSVALAIVAAALFAEGSRRWVKRQNGAGRKVYPVFVTGALLFFGLNVLGHYFFRFRILGEPGRLVPELDMAMILFGIEALRRFWNVPFPSPLAMRLSGAFVLMVAFGTVWSARNFVRHAWEIYPKEPDYRKRVEYRMSDWLASHMPDSRTFVTGSVRFWWDAWRDNAEVGGGSDQGLMNPNPSAAAWEILMGTDPELAVRWLQTLGADAIVVSDERSQDAYHDFRNLGRFAGVLPVLFDDQEGNVVYRVPRRYPSLARVVDTAQSKAAQPVVPATNTPLLRAYNGLVEQGPDSPTATHWNGTDSISVHASPRAGQSVLVQVTYDPAWRAYSAGKELNIRPDAMDFMAVDAPAGTQDITLVFEMPLENRVGYAITALTLLLCVFLVVAARRATPAD